MLSSKDIRNVKFSKSVGGYKQEEVDILLDKIEVDYEQFERVSRELQNRIDSLQKEIEGYQSTHNSIQNVLLSAQTLADQIVDDAKAKSEQIVRNAEASIEALSAREKELSSEIERSTEEKRRIAENEIEKMLKTAELKKESIEKAALDSVERQQKLYDRLTLEIAAFKADITSKYKEHLEILQSLPENVPSDPKSIAAAVSDVIDKAPTPESFVSTIAIEPEPINSYEDVSSSNIPSAPEQSESGFVIAPIDAE